jgi:glycosyltransferase involved in cell wall biosynthesis
VVSDFVKKEMQNYFEVSPDKIHVVHPGYRNEVFFPQAPEKVAAVKKKFALDNFILCVGETRKYKNMRAMIHAFSKISSPGLKLAIAGNINRLEKNLLQLPAELKLAERVTFLGRVSDEELASLYSGAVCFVFPSLYEGFGLPVLEAMACGCPVVASRQASIPEVCGDAAIFFDPNEIEDIRLALLRVLEDNGLAEVIRTKGLKRAELFNQRSSAEQIDKIFCKHL